LGQFREEKKVRKEGQWESNPTESLRDQVTIWKVTLGRKLYLGRIPLSWGRGKTARQKPGTRW